MSKYEIIKVDENEYRNRVASSILDFPGSIFYHPDFLAVAADILNLEFQPYICVSSGKLVGIANLLGGGKFGIKTSIIPPLFQYYGPVSFSDDIGVFKAFSEVIKTETDSAVFSLTPEESIKSDYPGWKTKNRLTYYLKPDSFDNMKKRSFNSVKSKVNKSIKAGVMIELSDRFHYNIYLASFTRQKKKAPLEENVLTNWVERLMTLNLAETYIAVYDNKPVAFLTMLIWGNYAYVWLSGSIPDYRHIGVNNFLVLKIGEQLYHRGVANWDMLGGDIESIGDFKKSFGSTPVTHLQIERNFTLKGKVYRNLMRLKARLND